MCSEAGLAAGARGRLDGITEKTEPILKSSYWGEKKGEVEKLVCCKNQKAFVVSPLPSWARL